MESGTPAAPNVPPVHLHPLSAVRAARGWSYRDLAEAVAFHARTQGVAMAARREKAWRWEHWGVVPDSESQRALALALGVSLAHIETRPWPAWLPTGAELPRTLPWTADGATAALRALLVDVEQDRRSFPIAGSDVLLDAGTVWSCGQWVAVAADAGGAGGAGGAEHPDGSGTDLARWLLAGADMLHDLLKLAPDIDPTALRRRVNADLHFAVDLLDQAATPVFAQRVCRAAADLTGIAARTCLDSGLHAAAQRYLLTGLRCAHAAGDRAVGAGIAVALGTHCASIGEEVAARRLLETVCP
jgi:hypothetical protein